jgi:3-oxoacyl-[acyl-carrier-protein] synthase II
VIVGTTSGEPEFVERLEDSRAAGAVSSAASADLATQYLSHLLAARLARDAGFRGPAITIPTACAAGNHAIATAAGFLRTGRADVMLAGGTDAFSRITFTGFARLGAIAPERCQPFDRNRKGMVPARARRCSCSSTRRTRGAAARASWPKWPAAACRATPFT